jgi:DNA-binding MarR family transcriptional regulator
MSFLILKNIPRYECLLEASRLFPDLDPSATEVFLRLMHAGDEAFRITDANLARHSLSQGRFMVLMLLMEKSSNCPHPKTPAELAELAGVTRATMTGLIDTLERDGLVKREPARDDRRMMSVTLTAKARALLDAVLPPHFRHMARLMATLDESERKTLVRLLNKILEQASVMGKPAPIVTPAGATSS